MGKKKKEQVQEKEEEVVNRDMMVKCEIMAEYVKRFDDFEKAANNANTIVWQTHIAYGKLETEIARGIYEDFFSMIRMECAYMLERLMKEMSLGTDSDEE